jgi:protein-S-isoprenylcysteine O-methyltransferase Ste14
MRLSPSAFLVALAAKERTTAVKLASLAAGSLVFLVVLPAVIFFVARSVIPSGGGGALPRSAELVVTAMFAATGLSLVAWAALEQWSVGHGTPTQTAPTRHLVTTGPYALCRNPIELGAVLYYFGVGACFGSLIHGVVCLALGLLVGSLFHRRVEEVELERRFGSEYLAYRQRTPFLIPGFRRRRR